MDGLPAPPVSWYGINYFGRLYLIPVYNQPPQPYYYPQWIQPPSYNPYNPYYRQKLYPSVIPTLYQEPSYSAPVTQRLEESVTCNLPKEPVLDGINTDGWATYYTPGVGGTGTRTANGEYFDGSEMTAASPYITGTTRPLYPFNSMIKVTDTRTGKSVVVRINDTGSFGKFPAGYGGIGKRIIDLSRGAMLALTGRLTSIPVHIEQVNA